mgnify:CR=1 FL=1
MIQFIMWIILISIIIVLFFAVKSFFDTRESYYEDFLKRNRPDLYEKRKKKRRWKK